MTRKHLPIIRDNPPPTDAGGALYVAPTSDREGRLCSNCVFWASHHDEYGHGECAIHEPDVDTRASMVCGYHVFGEPMGDEMMGPFRHAVRETVTPATSGLVEAPSGGTRCGNCMYFESGICLRVASKVVDDNEWVPAEVDADGCCAQWNGHP